MLSKLSVKKPFTVLVTVLLVTILGVVSFMEMTPDLLPSIELPYAVVVTTYVGASPEEVEMTVTKPVEQTLATLNNVENITSTSSENVSMVILEFNEETSMDAMGVDIREKLDTISGYWNDSVGSPLILKLNPDMMPVMVAAVGVENMEHTEVSAFVESEIIPLLESTEGVASVSATGLVEKQIQVVINQKKIDKINDKLQDSVSEKMEDAEKELDKAKKDIASGKKELEDKSKELSEGMTEASQGINSARLEMLKKELEVQDGEAELKKQETALIKGDKELSTKEKEVAEQKKTVTTKLKEAAAALAQIEAMEPYVSGPEKEALQAQKVLLKDGITQLTQAKDAIAAAEPELIAARKQIDQGKVAMASAKQQLENGKQQLEAAKKTLNEKEKEMNTKKAEAESKLTNAAGQIETGEKELEKQLEQFDETKENALDAAKVDDKITSDMVSKILQAQNFSMPAGYVQEENVDYLVRVGDKIEDLEELKGLVLFDLKIDDMDPVTLEDVADVFWSDNSDETYAKINGNEGVMLSFQKQTSYATAVVAGNLNDRFEEIEKNNSDVHFTALMDQGIYIKMVINSVLDNLVMGGILAIIILFVFLRDIRPTFIVACSIPLSVVFAIVLMYFSGISLNIISLSGLAVGVGMLVDNSIVVIENIFRLRNKGVSAAKAAVTGAIQVGAAITSSTLTTICVFLPIVFVKGITKQLFVDMALTIGYSLVASLIVALTLVPAMSATMLRTTKVKVKDDNSDNIIFRIYDKMVKWCLKNKVIVLFVAIVIMVGSIFGAMRNGTSFMAQMDSTQITVDLKMPEGSTLEDTILMSDKAMEQIQTITGVDTVGAMLGSGSGMAGMMGMSMGGGAQSKDSISMYVLLKEDKEKTSQEIAAEIETVCQDLDCEITASGSTMDISALGGSGVTIKIAGPDLDTLKELAIQVGKELETIEGTQNVLNGIDNPTGEIRITVDKEKAMLEGFTVAQVYMEIQKAIAGSEKATELSAEGNQYQILVTTDTQEEMTRGDIRDFILKTTDEDGEEKEIKLKDIAEISDDYSLSSISREAQQRYISVTAELADGYNIGNVSRAAEKQINSTVEMPNGYTLTYSGENETINEAMTQMVKMLLMALAFIYLIMVAQFQSLLSPFIVMFTIPLAFTGGFLGLWMTGKEVSIIAVLGFVMLSGVVVNNGIVLVDFINQLRIEGMEKKAAIVEAGKTRMRPILMTALTTILGLSTMAMGIGMGSEMMQPIAIVTIGGLLYATLMTLFVIPVMYDILNRKDIKVITDEELEVYIED